MAKREFLMLAHKWVPDKHGVAASFVSIKLDGHRCFWDGGISRGCYKDEVPWANLAKDERFVDRQIATGLWSRYGNVIHAPDWWLNNLPPCLLDGELFGGRQGFQDVSSTIKKLPEQRIDGDWKYVEYRVYGIPRLEEVFKPGEIDNKPNFVKTFGPDVLAWAKAAANKIKLLVPQAKQFQNNYSFLTKRLVENDVFRVHPQEQLPFNEEAAKERVHEALEEELGKGGEGLILRKGSSLWIPERSYDMLKVKSAEDDEAIVLGYTTGRETDRGSMHLGRMGAVICSYKGKRFELSGFTHDEREFKTDAARVWARENPDKECPDWIENPKFPRGTVITFKYRELTKDGIPKEARYFRKYQSV